jgi:hypothetical protein
MFTVIGRVCARQAREYHQKKRQYDTGEFHERKNNKSFTIQTVWANIEDNHKNSNQRRANHKDSPFPIFAVGKTNFSTKPYQ